MEDDGGGDVAGAPAVRFSARRKRWSRRISWALRGSEGGPVAVANSVGGDGCARHERERETEEGGELGRECGAVGEARGVVRGVAGEAKEEAGGG